MTLADPTDAVVLINGRQLDENQVLLLIVALSAFGTQMHETAKATDDAQARATAGDFARLAIKVLARMMEAP